MKKIKSIEERLKSKEGRFRQHLMGKRVDFSARSVVSPDSNLALDELGVPEKVAAALTIPEEVTEINYDRMIKLCAEGKVKYIIKPSE
jgi:DNA-directed RNA polymerase beta' subunit